DLLDRRREGPVLGRRVRRAVVAPLVGRVAQVPEGAAEERAHGAKHASPGLDVVALEGRAEAVAAAFAPELELVPLRVREVREVVREGHRVSHGAFWPVGRGPGDERFADNGPATGRHGRRRTPAGAEPAR